MKGINVLTAGLLGWAIFGVGLVIFVVAAIRSRGTRSHWSMLKETRYQQGVSFREWIEGK